MLQARRGDKLLADRSCRSLRSGQVVAELAVIERFAFERRVENAQRLNGVTGTHGEAFGAIRPIDTSILIRAKRGPDGQYRAAATDLWGDGSNKAFSQR